MRTTIERLGDFQIAFYAYSMFAGRFWQQARHHVASAELLHKSETFQARGVIAPMEDETIVNRTFGPNRSMWGSPTDDVHPLFTEHTALDSCASRWTQPRSGEDHGIETRKLLERGDHGTENETVSGGEDHGTLY